MTIVKTCAAQGMSVYARNDALQSVIQIVPYDWDANEYYGWTGSGTIISSAGHILTNAHVITDEDGDALEVLPIWTADAKHPSGAAQFSFLAVLVDVNPELDLALLEIVANSEFEYLPDNYQFQHVPVGTIDGMQLGDAVFVIGFPGISGNTITYTGGVVSGYLGTDFSGGGDSWVKTDARFAPGNSGGGAFDEEGALVGIPTILLVGTQVGAVQELFRPINYAYDMIRRNIPLEAVQVGPRTTSPRPVNGYGDASRHLAPGAAVIRSVVTINGSLDLTDAHYFQDRIAHSFSFLMPRAGFLDLVVRSTDFDPYVFVMAPGGRIVLEVDDSPGANFDVEENFYADERGQYIVIITTALPRESGAYVFGLSAGDEVGSVEVTRSEVPIGPGSRSGSTYSGSWSGFLHDTAGGRGAVVATLLQTGNASVEGTWESMFEWGATSGKIVGLIQSDGLFLELYPDDESACPFSGLAELSGYTIAGTYAAFDCSVPIVGSVSMTKRH